MPTIPSALNPKIVIEFRDFMLKTNMFALAMGVVIGNAVGKVVNSFVADMIMPVVGLVQPSGDWRGLKLWVFGIGNILGTMLDFAIIAAVVFLVTKLFMKPEAPPPPTPSKACPQCMETIHIDAKRCKFCTSTM